MGPATVRRALLVYAIVPSLALAFALVTVASFAMLDVTRAARDDGVRRDVERAAALGELEAVRAVVERHRGAPLGVVTPTVAAFGLELAEARAVVIDPGRRAGRGLIVAPIRGAGVEAYVVGRLAPGPAWHAARNWIRVLAFVGVGAAVAFGGLIALLGARLVLGPLSALRRAAAEAQLDELLGAGSIAPNEIADVAHTFRRTLRKLHDEQRQIEQQHQALERMQSSLIRASKLASVGRLAAGVAHEIGNPLAAVRGYLSLLDRGLEPSEQAEVLARSQRELGRIHDTIKKLLTYARPDEDGGPPVLVDTEAVVADAVGLLRNHPSLRGVELVVHAPEGGLGRALAHAGPLEQVLVNLLLNAAQAMVDAPSPRIEVRWRSDGDVRTLEIEDRGPGVPAELREQIFDPFFTTKAPGDGTGLGLAISRALMERMDGDLEVTDGEAGGACFVLRLAAATSSTRGATDEPSATDGAV